MDKSLSILLLSAAAIPFFAPPAARAQGQPAEIGLVVSSAHPKIINAIGGKTTIEAVVRNTAPLGSDNLDYQIQFQLPYGVSPLNTGTLAAQSERKWTYEFDATLLQQPIQTSDFIATAIVTAPGTSNSPFSLATKIDVRSPANPLFALPTIGTNYNFVEEPTISPEQFAATGSGESVAIAAPQVIGDPPLDAALDFDRLEAVGDPQIKADNINLFKMLPALQDGQDPSQVGRKPFDVFLDVSRAGTFKKTFFLYFSDEDVPGARPQGSVVRTLTYVVTVVPEPASTALVSIGAIIVVLPTRRRRFKS